MKLNYFADTDSLYIELSEKPSVDSLEISEGVVLDYDELGNLVGIDIDNASRKVQLIDLYLSGLQTISERRPLKIELILSDMPLEVEVKKVFQHTNC